MSWLSALFLQHPHAVIVLSEKNQKILKVNAKAVQMYGYNSSQMNELSWPDIFINYLVPTHHDWSTAPLQSTTHSSAEQRHRCLNGAEIIVRVETIAVDFEQQKAHCLIIEDISDFIQIKKRLLESNSWFDRAQKIAQLGSWDWNIPENKIYLSDQSYAILEMDPTVGQIEGVAFDLFMSYVYYEDRSDLLLRIGQSLSTGESFKVEYRIQTPGQNQIKYVQTEAHLTYGHLNGSVGLFGTMQDISESKENALELMASQQQLKELTAYLEKIREQERHHISQELHDDLGQSLTVLHLGLSWLGKHQHIQDPALLQRVQLLKNIANSLLSNLRLMMSRLRPLALDELGLQAALDGLINDLRLSTELNYFLYYGASGYDLSPQVATVVFRFVQEAITNTIKHAQADTITIQVIGVDACLHVQVIDNGIGFTTEDEVTGMGIIGMRERISWLGGQLVISNLELGGTKLLAIIPFGV